MRNIRNNVALSFWAFIFLRRFDQKLKTKKSKKWTTRIKKVTNTENTTKITQQFEVYKLSKNKRGRGKGREGKGSEGWRKRKASFWVFWALRELGSVFLKKKKKARPSPPTPPVLSPPPPSLIPYFSNVFKTFQTFPCKSFFWIRSFDFELLASSFRFSPIAQSTTLNTAKLFFSFVFFPFNLLCFSPRGE